MCSPKGQWLDVSPELTVVAQYHITPTLFTSLHVHKHIHHSSPVSPLSEIWHISPVRRSWDSLWCDISYPVSRVFVWPSLIKILLSSYRIMPHYPLLVSAQAETYILTTLTHPGRLGLLPCTSSPELVCLILYRDANYQSPGGEDPPRHCYLWSFVFFSTNDKLSLLVTQFHIHSSTSL